MSSPAPYSLASDHHYPAHPAMLKALERVNEGFLPSYEGDRYSVAAKELLCDKLKAQSAFFVFNGTAANVLALKLYLPPASSVICSDVAHMFFDEAGSPEALAGAKLLPARSRNGKIELSSVREYLSRQHDPHFAPVRMISITQPTELGTVYSEKELSEITEVCRQYGLKLHIDGARLPQAAHFLESSWEGCTHGADVISFGGTKNGLLFGEAVVLRTPSLYPGHETKIRKQLLQLPSKSRYVGAQFLAFFEEDLGLKLAQINHERALILKQGLEDLGISPLYPVESNAVFAQIPKKSRTALRKKYFFYVWDPETSLCRLMTSFQLSEDLIREFLKELKDSLT